MPTAFIIAGFDLQNTAASKKYAVLEEGLKKKGYTVVASDISWKRKTPTQYALEFITFYNKHKSERNIIIGNSFGAVVAFISAADTKPDALYLCSLSPFFKEDRGKRPDSYGINIFGKRRMEDLWSISAQNITDGISRLNIYTVVVYGQKEHQTSSTLVARCKNTAKQIHNAEIFELPNAPHSMTNEVYSQELLKYINNH